MKHDIKRGDWVRVVSNKTARGKVLNLSSDALGMPIASVLFSDHDRVEVISLNWLKKEYTHE